MKRLSCRLEPPTGADNDEKFRSQALLQHFVLTYQKSCLTSLSYLPCVAALRRTQADTTVVTPQKAMDPIPAPTSIAKTAAVMQIVMKARGRSSRTSILCPDIRASFASIEDNDMPICLLNSEEDNNMGFEDGNGEDVDLLSDSPIISSVWTADSPSPVDSTAVKVLHVEMSSPYSAKHDDGYHKKECSPVSTSMVSPFNTPPCSPFARILKETDALSALRGQVLEPKMINAAEDLLCGSITDAIASSGTGGDHQYLNIQ